MAVCNCGCERRIGLGSRRGMNKNIRRADDLAKLEFGRDHFAAVVEGADPAVVADANPEELLDRLVSEINEGK